MTSSRWLVIDVFKVMRPRAATLQVELEGSVRKYVHATSALREFVEVSRRGIQEYSERYEQLEAKLKLSQVGKAPGPSEPLSPGTVTLSDEDVQVVVDALRDYGEIITARFPTMLLDMALIYLIALFEAYIADSLRAVLVFRPEAMRSRKQITYETVLSFDDRDQMIEAMASREINDVAYKGFRDQVAHYTDRFGVSILPSDVDEDAIVEAMARRNLLVHNNGVVNEVYISTVPAASGRVGERLTVEQDYWDRIAQELSRIAAHVHAVLRDKFVSSPSGGSAEQ
jgi:hypothetical protein